MGPQWVVVLDASPPAHGGNGAAGDALHTALDRARLLVPDERLATVLPGRDTPPQLPPAPLVLRTGTTGAEVMLAATYVLARHPGAILLFLPSDLPAWSERTLLQHLVAASLFTRRHPETVTTLAIAGGDAHPSWWLEPERPAAGGDELAPRALRRVTLAARGANGAGPPRRGALAGTACFSVWGPTLWALGRRCLGDLTERCEELRLVLRAIGDGRAMRREELRVLGRIAACAGGAGFLPAVLDGARDVVRVLPVTAGEAS